MDNKPFTYAAEQLLEINRNIGEVIDALLSGKVTKEDLEKWKIVIKSLDEAHIEVVGAYVFSGSAADDFFGDIQKALGERTKE